MLDDNASRPSHWQLLPDSVLLHVFAYVEAFELLRAARVCKAWHRVATDEFLWKTLFYKDWKISKVVPRAPEKDSWRLEYKRLKYHTPLVESEVLTQHTNQVLHVSFSHNGEMFASSSKDGFIKVWNAGYPATVRYNANMKEFGWKYTQYSQFNESDTLLLVSGVHSGLHSTTGEIFVFSVDGEFTLQSKVLNKPYDIFGTWYNDTYLLSGHLTWLGHMVSSSILWLNNAYQETDIADKSVVAKLYRFYNKNASSIRTIMIADCLSTEDDACDTTDDAAVADVDTVSHMESVSNVRGNPLSHNVFVASAERSSHSSSLPRKSNLTSRSCPNASPGVQKNHHDALLGGMEGLHLNKEREQKRIRKDTDPFDGSMILLEDSWKDDDESPDTDEDDLAAFGPLDCRNYQPRSLPTLQSELTCPTDIVRHAPSKVTEEDEGVILDTQEKYLIFTTGSETYTPHQIGFKRIKPFRFKDKISLSLMEKLAEQRERMLMRSSSPNYLDHASVEHMFDKVDHLIDLHGHIIGMALSPDQRYLYVNNRPWPKNYVIDNPLHPPPIAQEIDIHVIDLVTLKEVGTMLRSHKAYTPNDECFFIFLDVCNEYVASGAEDKHGYLWDRHYGICLTRFPHMDVVNSVVFNPMDSEMLITASDDYTLKVWRSKNRLEEIGANGTESESKAVT